MCFISVICYKDYFYFLVFWILELLGSIIMNFLAKGYDLENELKKKLQNDFKNDFKNEYLGLLSLVIADLLAGFLVIYTKCSLPKKQKGKLVKANSKGSIILIYNSPINNTKKLLLLISISFLDFVARSGFFWFNLIFNTEERVLNKSQTNFIIILDILFRYFFSSLILKTKLYKHHNFAIKVSIIGFFIMSALDIFSIIFDNKNEVWHIIIFIILLLPRAIVFPLEDVINKILLSDDFLLPHSLMFIRGLIEFLIISIISLVLFLTGKFDDLKYELNISYIVIFKIVNIIIYSVKAFCLMKVIYIYTSQYVSFLIISESLASTINIFIDSFDIQKDMPFYKNPITMLLALLSLIIIIFATLMYNEMIIIKKWGLDEKTKENLLIKGKEDYEETFKNNEGEDSDDENDDNNSQIKRKKTSKTENSTDNSIDNKNDNNNGNFIKDNTIQKIELKNIEKKKYFLNL